MAARIRKTDPCRCGSGKQYRYCHGAKPVQERDPAPPRRAAFLLTIGIATPLVLLLVFGQATGLITEPAATQRVWSEAHGHYHDVASDDEPIDEPEPEPTASTEQASTEPAGTQPDGPAPPGKVWNEAHGHWHDADGTEPIDDIPDWDDDEVGDARFERDFRIEPPPGDPPPGKVWSDAHGHYHDLP